MLDYSSAGGDSSSIGNLVGCQTGVQIDNALAVDCAGLLFNRATINIVLQHRKTVTVEIWYWTGDFDSNVRLVRERYRTELTGSYGNCPSGVYSVPFLERVSGAGGVYGFIDDICGDFEADNFFDVEIVIP